MTAMNMTQEVDDPASVVRSFIQAMNQWETDSWEAQRRSRTTQKPALYQLEVRSRLDSLFARFCSPKERKYGRQGSFQKPPEYNPDTEHITATEIDPSSHRAWVFTRRLVLLGGGHYRYTLVRVDGRWRIDTLKQESNGEWRGAIL